MSRIRARDTGPERILRSALCSEGVRGYRLHYKSVPGRPDIAFVGRRVAVFVHGCFWHGCPFCQPVRPKSNARFWSRKLDRNVERDAEKTRALRGMGWKVVTVWACRLARSPLTQVRRIERVLAHR